MKDTTTFLMKYSQEYASTNMLPSRMRQTNQRKNLKAMLLTSITVRFPCFRDSDAMTRL